MVASIVVGVIIYQDEIIELFWGQVNKSLKYPIESTRTEVSFWVNFPSISIVLHDAVMRTPDFSKTEPLVEARLVSFELSLVDLLTKELRVKKINARDGRLVLTINEEGRANYFVMKNKGQTTAQKATLYLPNLRLSNFSLTFSDYRTQLTSAFQVNELRSSLRYGDSRLHASIKGDLVGKFLGLGDLNLEGDKGIVLDADIVYLEDSKKLEISPSRITIRNSVFRVTGAYWFDESRQMDLTLEGLDTDLQSLVALLPDKYGQAVEAYQSEGDVTFSATFKGNLDKPPKVDVNFSGSNVSFFHPDYDTRLRDLQFSGSLSNGEQQSPETTRFAIKNISGKLADRPFSASMTVVNLNNPTLSLRLETDQELGHLLQFFPVKEITSASGEVHIDILVDGLLDDLKNVKTAGNVTTSGQISLRQVNLGINEIQQPLDQLNGDLIFNKSDLAISDLTGKWGKSDFRITGIFKNVLSYLFFENELLVIEADLRSNLVELEEILSAGPASKTGYTFNINPALKIDLNCFVQRLAFQRFRGREVRGGIRVEDQTISTPTLSFLSAGGNVVAGVRINAQQPEETAIHAKASFKGIEIDSVFYVFNNFRQDFLVDSNLRGKINADINTLLRLDQRLRLIPETLFSQVSFSIAGGELNNFEPMERLSKYIQYGDLSHLRFSELKNDLVIQDQTVFIPQMDVSSNVSNIRIKGTHTFDQTIDYQLKVPLNNRPRHDKDEMFGAIEEDASGRAHLFLTIKGTTDDYKIAYDKRAVVQKVKEDIKKEGRELVETFKEKGKEEKEEVVLEEEDFFDFEEER